MVGFGRLASCLHSPSFLYYPHKRGFKIFLNFPLINVLRESINPTLFFIINFQKIKSICTHKSKKKTHNYNKFVCVNNHFIFLKSVHYISQLIIY